MTRRLALFAALLAFTTAPARADQARLIAALPPAAGITLDWLKLELSSASADAVVELEDGTKLACTASELGAIIQEKGKPVFLPLAPLDAGGCRLFAGAGATAYMISRSPADGRHELYVMRVLPAGPKITKLVASDDFIAAAAGDGQETYFAVGAWIARVGPGMDKPEIYFKADATITGLAYSPAAGLFYATAKGVARLGKGYQGMLLAAPRPQPSVRGDALYVRLAGGSDMLRVSGLAGLASAPWP